MTSPSTNGSTPPNGVPTLTSVGRVANIPVVNDSLNQLHAIANSTTITTKAYNLAEGIVKSGYSLAEPVLGYGRPVIEGVDGYANKGLDFAEKTFPYPFQTKTEQIVADARKPADQAYGVAKGVYDNRIAPLQGNAVVQKAVDSIYSLNQQISSTYTGGVKMVYDVTGDAQAKLHALSQALLDELAKLQKDGSTLPAAAKENLTKAYNDLSAVVFDKEKPAGEKTKEVVSYIQSTLQPVLDGALRILHTTKEKAEEGADAAKEKTKEKADKGKDAVNGVIDQHQ
ncbi:hypothetical protein BDY24DRAFT_378866 [Mrakia frigida]|uniref:uncharacterized protein n=1 Tax=Mrakia frigida TaxID=29902 RepID=UPI003FCC1332